MSVFDPSDSQIAIYEYCYLANNDLGVNDVEGKYTLRQHPSNGTLIIHTDWSVVGVTRPTDGVIPATPAADRVTYWKREYKKAHVIMKESWYRLICLLRQQVASETEEQACDWIIANWEA